MKKFISILCCLIALGCILWPFLSEPKAQPWIGEFGRLPVQQGGRIKPLDSVARVSLLALSGRQTLRSEGHPSIGATEWLFKVATQPALADNMRIFRIDHPQVLSLIEAKHAGPFFSYQDLSPAFDRIHQAKQALEQASAKADRYTEAIEQLDQKLTLYHGLIHSFRPFAVAAQDTYLEYMSWQALIPVGVESIKNQGHLDEAGQDVMNRFIFLAERYLHLSKIALLGLVPHDDSWLNVGQGLLSAISDGQLSPILIDYVTLAQAAESQDAASIAAIVDRLSNRLRPAFAEWRLILEQGFNAVMPFLSALSIYILSVIIIFVSWLCPPNYRQMLRKTAWLTMLLALCLHTGGIGVRMLLQGRPPVTSLYASALFVGWAAVGMSLMLEYIFKHGLGIVVGGLLGFLTLLIAHHLSLGEDTLEVVRAVLDANFWLSTHVVMVTLGYSAMFLAGTLGCLYVVHQLIGFKAHQVVQKNLFRMAYGTTCFALLFTFIGTLLGGIWADQSWGRFWGWDPKENGALLIVLWGSIMLHAKIARMIAERGFMLAAIFGNILTSWSWFGTNMLGIGLHSYGFMDQAFWALAAFMLTQLIFIILGLLQRPSPINPSA